MRVLFAIADEAVSTDLLEAHERAVAEAFAYIEREACFTRRGRNGAFRVRGDGVVDAACDTDYRAPAIRSCTRTSSWRT